VNAAAIDALTILRSTSGKYATKQFSPKKDGTIQNRSYGNEKFFSVVTVEVSDVVQLGHALAQLVDKPFDFVIRGAPLPGINRKHARRLLYPDKKTGDAATFQRFFREFRDTFARAHAWARRSEPALVERRHVPALRQRRLLPT
jgi:hypothetical protein